MQTMLGRNTMLSTLEGVLMLDRGLLQMEVECRSLAPLILECLEAPRVKFCAVNIVLLLSEISNQHNVFDSITNDFTLNIDSIGD